MGFKSRLDRFRSEMRPTIRELKFLTHKVKNNPLSLSGAIILLFFFAIFMLVNLIVDTAYAYIDPRFKL